jgi:hypothetical protein
VPAKRTQRVARIIRMGRSPREGTRQPPDMSNAQRSGWPASLPSCRKGNAAVRALSEPNSIDILRDRYIISQSYKRIHPSVLLCDHGIPARLRSGCCDHLPNWAEILRSPAGNGTSRQR